MNTENQDPNVQPQNNPTPQPAAVPTPQPAPVPDPIPNANQATINAAPAQLKAPGAVGALICGIICISTFYLCGIAGIVCGILALSNGGRAKRMFRNNPGSYSEGSLKMAKTGWTLGLIGLILSGIALIVWTLALADM